MQTKWLPKSGKLSCRYEMANKKERTHGGKETKKRNSKQKTTTTLLSEKKEEARNVSEQRVKGWIHVIRVHDTTH